MGNGADDRLNTSERIAEARAKGYEDEACCGCGNFTLMSTDVPATLKCDTCGNKQISKHALDDSMAFSDLDIKR